MIIFYIYDVTRRQTSLISKSSNHSTEALEGTAIGEEIPVSTAILLEKILHVFKNYLQMYLNWIKLY